MWDLGWKDCGVGNDVDRVRADDVDDEDGRACRDRVAVRSDRLELDEAVLQDDVDFPEAAARRRDAEIDLTRESDGTLHVKRTVVLQPEHRAHRGGDADNGGATKGESEWDRGEEPERRCQAGEAADAKEG
jgi:hypothetical protein